MDAIETKTIERDGQTFRIRIYADADAPNPLEDWDEMGTILSLNRRHVNFDPDGVEAAIGDPDAVPLSYYEHGLVPVVGRRGIARRCPLPVGFGRLRRRLAARRRDARIRPPLRRLDPPALHAEACPPGVRSLYAVVQRRHLRLRDRACRRLRCLRRRAGRALSIAAGDSSGWITA